MTGPSGNGATAGRKGSGGTNLAKILEGVNPAPVLVGPVDPQRVVSHQFGGDGGQGLGVVPGQDRQQRLFLRDDVDAVGVALADGPALGAGAHRAEVLDAVDALAAVGP